MIRLLYIPCNSYLAGHAKAARICHISDVSMRRNCGPSRDQSTAGRGCRNLYGLEAARKSRRSYHIRTSLSQRTFRCRSERCDPFWRQTTSSRARRSWSPDL